jgi:catechol 2,3-dioxygenase-like lactoylglutathione lyase family enzyme
MIVGYNHAQISVPDGVAEKVRQFYGEFLGLAEMPVPLGLQGRGLIWFHVGNLQLHVGVEEGVNRLATRAHLAYEVDDIAALRTRMIEKQIEMIEQPKVTGFDRFHITDPFGNRVEFIGRDSG